ncbi:hypothetical protein JCM17380_21930 [Desulfosporosinus burensis]
MDGPPLSKIGGMMTIKKLYTNLYTFVDNLNKLRVVNNNYTIYCCRKGLCKYNIKFSRGYQQVDSEFLKIIHSG